jgi:hypothetical protein
MQQMWNTLSVNGLDEISFYHCLKRGNLGDEMVYYNSKTMEFYQFIGNEDNIRVVRCSFTSGTKITVFISLDDVQDFVAGKFTF